MVSFSILEGRARDFGIDFKMRELMNIEIKEET